MQQRLLEESVCEWVASDLQLLMDMKGTDVPPPPSTQKKKKKRRYGNTSPLPGPQVCDILKSPQSCSGRTGSCGRVCLSSLYFFNLTCQGHFVIVTQVGRFHLCQRSNQRPKSALILTTNSYQSQGIYVVKTVTDIY